MSEYPLDWSASEADTEEQKTYVSNIFDAACNDYDNTALRFFPFAADAAVKILQPHRG